MGITHVVGAMMYTNDPKTKAALTVMIPRKVDSAYVRAYILVGGCLEAETLVVRVMHTDGDIGCVQVGKDRPKPAEQQYES